MELKIAQIPVAARDIDNDTSTEVEKIVRVLKISS